MTAATRRTRKNVNRDKADKAGSQPRHAHVTGSRCPVCKPYSRADMTAPPVAQGELPQPTSRAGDQLRRVMRQETLHQRQETQLRAQLSGLQRALGRQSGRRGS